MYFIGLQSNLLSLWLAIQNQRCVDKRSPASPSHDYARPYIAIWIQNLVDSLDGMSLIICPDLAQSDFHYFFSFKLHLGGKHDEEVKVAVSNWLKELSAELYAAGIQNLV